MGAASRTNVPENFSNEGKMFWWLYDQAAQTYFELNLDKCKEMCLDLLLKARLPLLARTKTLQLGMFMHRMLLHLLTYVIVACCVNINDADAYLDLSLGVCDEMDAIDPNDPATNKLREHAEKLRVKFAAEKIRLAPYNEKPADKGDKEQLTSSPGLALRGRAHGTMEGKESLKSQQVEGEDEDGKALAEGG